MGSVLIYMVLVCWIFYMNTSGNCVTVDLIHRDSHLSPYHDPTKTRFQLRRNAFDRSLARKNSLFSAPLSTAGGEYLIEYKIGTPPVRQLSIADTGSDLTWIQCKPCTSCYDQDYPLFDPSTTNSFSFVPCQSNACNSPCAADDHNNVCQYYVAYGDNSYTRGDMATETLSLGNATLPNFIFGCGRNNAGTFMSTGSGIFGLGRGAVSVVNQQSKSVGGRFSYCLTSSVDSVNVSSKISFGGDAVVEGGLSSTPLVEKSPDSFYYVTLEGLSVGERRIEGGKQEIIIDSGTTLSYVPSQVYSGIEERLVEVIKGRRRVRDPEGTFNLCYELGKGSGGEFVYPAVTAHFKDADVVLAQSSIFVEVEEGRACLTILPSQDQISIFGNLHQANYLIGYDLVRKQINFRQTDCSNYPHPTI